MKKVLLTGATGFVGWHCASHLLRLGYEVHATGRSSPQLPQSGVHWHSSDLLQRADTERVVSEVEPTHLLHLAWFTRPGEFWTARANLDWVSATLDLVKCFTARGGRRVVIAGTCAEYDWRYGYLSESLTPANPGTLYGACKHALNLMVEAYARDAGVSLGWGRLFYLYGPREDPRRFVPSVIRSLLEGKPALCSDGRQLRDFLYVEDAADALVTLLESGIQGPVNIASGEALALQAIATQIAITIGRPDLLRLGARAPGDQEAPLIVGDPTRLRRDAGWTQRFDLATGLERTIDWWRSQLTPECQ